MNDFDDIRPYFDSEFKDNFAKLLQDEKFCSVLKSLYESDSESAVIAQLPIMNTIDDLQRLIVYPLLRKLVATTSGGLTYSGISELDSQKRYLFLSNHRDIILDPAFLNMIMFDAGFSRTEIAIGDNLFIYNWIEQLVKLNRAFVVKRNLAFREQLSASKQLSAYVRYAITEKRMPVWIAQKEGRAKDGNDHTQMAILKMLNMSNTKSLVDGFKELNIVPLAISYELEPCGILKVDELLKRKHDSSFKKTPADDMQSMGNGIMQFKGKIHYGFGEPLNDKIEEICNGLRPNDAIQAITDYIDANVHLQYKLWPNNYVACDLLEGNNRHANYYSEEEKSAFVKYMNDDLSKFDFDINEATAQYLEMYANPVLNQEKHLV